MFPSGRREVTVSLSLRQGRRVWGIWVATNNNSWYSNGTVANIKWDRGIPIGKWFHLVGTYDGNVVNCYLDGEKEAPFHTVGISGNITEGPDPFALDVN